jgi:hypothetical protein
MWNFVMDKSGAGAGFLRELRFPLPIYIPSASPQSSSLSPEAGTVGQEWPQCQKPHKPNNNNKYIYIGLYIHWYRGVCPGTQVAVWVSRFRNRSNNSSCWCPVNTCGRLGLRIVGIHEGTWCCSCSCLTLWWPYIYIYKICQEGAQLNYIFSYNKNPINYVIIIGLDSTKSNFLNDFYAFIQNYILRTECWGEYLDQRGMMWREIGGNCIMRSFITCTPRQT